MKKILLTLTMATTSVLMAYGQGRVAFNNEIAVGSGPLSITNNPAYAAAGQGAAGANLGTAYSVQLLWAPQASYASQAAFLAAVLGSSTPGTFEGDTIGTGAGFFNNLTTPNPVGTSMPVGAYTMQARAWYNGGSYATFAAALAAGANTGYGAFFNLSSTASPNGAPNTPVASFVVSASPVPEPSTLALAGLGAAAMLIFRRRK